jgi:hypothetical protein
MKTNKLFLTTKFVKDFKKQTSKSEVKVKKINIKDIKQGSAKKGLETISPKSSARNSNVANKTFEILNEINGFNEKTENIINPSTISIDKLKQTISTDDRRLINKGIVDICDFKLNSQTPSKAESKNPSTANTRINSKRTDIGSKDVSTKEMRSVSKSTTKLVTKALTDIKKKNVIMSTPLAAKAASIVKIDKKSLTFKKPLDPKLKSKSPVTKKEQANTKLKSDNINNINSVNNNDSNSIVNDSSIKVRQVIANPNFNSNVKTLDVDMVKTLDLQTLDDPPIKQRKNNILINLDFDKGKECLNMDSLKNESYNFVINFNNFVYPDNSTLEQNNILVTDSVRRNKNTSILRTNYDLSTIMVNDENNEANIGNKECKFIGGVRYKNDNYIITMKKFLGLTPEAFYNIILYSHDFYDELLKSHPMVASKANKIMKDKVLHVIDGFKKAYEGHFEIYEYYLHYNKRLKNLDLMIKPKILSDNINTITFSMSFKYTKSPELMQVWKIDLKRKKDIAFWITSEVESVNHFLTT